MLRWFKKMSAKVSRRRTPTALLQEKKVRAFLAVSKTSYPCAAAYLFSISHLIWVVTMDMNMNKFGRPTHKGDSSFCAGKSLTQNPASSSSSSAQKKKPPTAKKIFSRLFKAMGFRKGTSPANQPNSKPNCPELKAKECSKVSPGTGKPLKASTSPAKQPNSKPSCPELKTKECSELSPGGGKPLQVTKNLQLQEERNEVTNSLKDVGKQGFDDWLVRKERWKVRSVNVRKRGSDGFFIGILLVVVLLGLLEGKISAIFCASCCCCFFNGIHFAGASPNWHL